MHHFCDPDAQFGFCVTGSMQACQAKEYPSSRLRITNVMSVPSAMVGSHVRQTAANASFDGGGSKDM
jgi:hypothetical protein